MTYDEIDAFLTIVETGNFSAAGKALFITQPALSRKVASLEAELGYKLFNRGRGVRSVQLTDEGAEFVSIAGTLKTLMERSKNIPLVTKKRFALVEATCLSNQLPEVNNNFLKLASNVNFSYSTQKDTIAYSMVENGSADTAIVSTVYPSKFVDTVPIYSDRMVVVSNKKLVDGDSISSTALNPENELRFSWSPQIDAWHNIHFSWMSQIPPWNKERAHTYENFIYKASTDNIDMLENYLKVDNIWFFATSIIAEKMSKNPNFHCYEILNAPPSWDVYYLKPKDCENKYVEMYINCIKESLPKNRHITIY